MREDKSALEMGLVSINSLLTSIYDETIIGNEFLSSIKDSLIMDFKAYFESPKINVTDNLNKSGNFQLMEIRKQTNILNDIRELLEENQHKKIVRETINRPKDYGKNNVFIENQNILNINKLPNEKNAKKLTKLFDSMIKFFEIDSKKLLRMNEFFVSFDSTLKSLIPSIWKFATGVIYLTSALILMSYISLTGILKLALLLPLLGFGLGQFFGIIGKTLKKLNWVKTYLYLKALPNLFEKIGKSILFIAIGLLFFEVVGWAPMFKFIAALGMMSVIFKTMMDKRGNFLGTKFILALAFGIWLLASRLELLDKVNWSSIFKLSTFIATLAVAVFIYTRLNGKSDFKMNPLTVIALSIFMIALSFTHYKDIAWSSIFKLSVFITGLGLALKVGDFSKDRKISPISILAIGLLMLVFSLIKFQEVDVTKLIGITAAIGILGFVINKLLKGTTGALSNFSFKNIGRMKAPSGLFGFAIGIAFLTLALYAFAEVPFSGLVKGITFILLLGLALRIFPNRKDMGLLGFSFGLGLMVLAILAFNELPFWAMTKMVLFIVTLGLILKTLYKEKPNSMVSFAFGLGLVVLALFAMNELPFWAMIKTLVFLGVLGLVLKLYNQTTLMTMLGLAAGVLALGIVFALIGSLNPNPIALITFTVFVVVMGAIIILMSILAPLIQSGSIALLVMGAALLVAGFAFKKISELEINFPNIFSFIGATIALTLTFALLAIPLIVAGIGALLFIIVGLAGIIGAEALYAISKTKINHDNIEKFTDAVNILSWIFTDNIVGILGAIIPAVLFIVIAIALISAAGVLMLINKITISSIKIDKFNDAVGLIIKGFDRFGIIKMGKTAIKAGMLLPILFVSYLAALTIEKINKLELRPVQMGKFTESFTLLIDTVSKAINESKDKLKEIAPGIKVVKDIVNVSSGLADIVMKMGDMRFNEYDVKNGKLVLVRQRKLTDKDFMAVGTNIGILIESLTKPITEMGRNSTSFTIGNKVIANPFKDNTSLKGMDFIKRMGEAYQPLVDAVSKMASAEMADPKKTALLASNMVALIVTYKTIFEVLEEIKLKNARKVIEEIEKLSSILQELKVKEYDKFVSITTKFVENFADDVKWRKIKSNVTFIKREFQDMTKAINGIDINKAKSFENNIKLLVDKKNTQNLGEILELLKEMFNLMSEPRNVAIQGPALGPTTNLGQVNNQTGTNNSNQIPGTIPVNQNDKNKNGLTEKEEQLLKLLTENFSDFGGTLSSINQKLGGTLKVKSVDPSNKI